MIFSILLLVVIAFLSYRASPQERAEDAHLLIGVSRFFEIFGVRRPLRYEPAPVPAGDYDHAVHVDHPEAPSLLAPYLNTDVDEEPKLGGKHKQTASPSPGDDLPG